MHVAMQRSSSEASNVQTVSDVIGVTFCGRENYSLLNGGIPQQMIQQTVLMQQIINKMHALLDVFMAR